MSIYVPNTVQFVPRVRFNSVIEHFFRSRCEKSEYVFRISLKHKKNRPNGEKNVCKIDISANRGQNPPVLPKSALNNGGVFDTILMKIQSNSRIHDDFDVCAKI